MSEKNTILIVDDKEVNRECLIKLLEDDASEQGQTELPQYFLGFSHGQILIHGVCTFLPFLC